MSDFAESCDKKCEQFSNTRDKYVGCLEKCIMGLSILLICCGVGAFSAGAIFVELDAWAAIERHMDDVEVRVFLICATLSTLAVILGVLGIVLARKRDCTNGWTAAFGILLTFFCVIPLFNESVSFTKLKQVTP